jgi:NAD(P)H-flavin reductase
MSPATVSAALAADKGPPTPMLAHPATVTSIEDEAYAIKTYTLAFKDPAVRQDYRFLAGQFNMIYLPGIGEVPISLSSAPSEQAKLGHTIRYAGNVTQAIAHLQVGDTVGLRGPYGSAWPLAQLRGRDVCIVAGGIGLAPLRPALYDILENRGDFGAVYVLYGAKTPRDLLYTRQFDAWREQDVEVHVTVDRADERWKGHTGVVTTLFPRVELEPDRTSVLTCGPEVMIRFVIYEFLSRGLTEQNLYLSMERNMKCGTGFCGHCQFGPTFVCKEGPVFEYADIAPFFGAVENF